MRIGHLSDDERVELLREIAITWSAGVDRFIVVVKGGDTCCTFFRGSVYRFEKDFESKFFVLFHHI